MKSLIDEPLLRIYFGAPDDDGNVRVELLSRSQLHRRHADEFTVPPTGYSPLPQEDWLNGGRIDPDNPLLQDLLRPLKGLTVRVMPYGLIIVNPPKDRVPTIRREMIRSLRSHHYTVIQVNEGNRRLLFGRWVSFFSPLPPE